MKGIMEQEALRQKALRMQAEMERKYGTITQTKRTGQKDVTGQAKGAAGGPAGPGKGQKIARKPAGPAPLKSAARGEKGPAARPSGSTRTKPNKRENEFMLNMMILRNTLRANAPECRERARLAGKWVWRDIRLLTVLVDRIQDAMLRTMPESRDDYYTAYALHGHYELHIDGPIRTARHLLVTDRHLAAMAEAAMKSECILCMREGSEIGQCPLREALLESAPPTETEPEGLIRVCEYRKAAGQLVQGKDVTV